MTDLLEAALAYARAGWPVFPCNEMPDVPSAKKKQAKAPRVGSDRDANFNVIPKTGGLYKATRDEKQIRTWWRQWPKALIGVPTGKASGVFVVDLDPRGEETLADVEKRLIDAVGELPPGLRSITQSGGAHYWFKLPEGEETPRNAAKKLDAVDWRGDGGYVIVPPSMMLDGKGYAWAVGPDEAEPAVAPAKLLDLIYQRGAFAKVPPARKAGQMSGPASGPGAGSSGRGRWDEDERARKAVKDYLRGALDRASAEVRSAVTGTRGTTLNSVAFSLGKYLVPGGLTEREVWAALSDAADANGMTAVDGEAERDAKITRGLDAGKAHAGDGQATLDRIASEARQRGGGRGFGRRPEPPPHGSVPDGPDGPSERMELYDEREAGMDAPPGGAQTDLDVVRDCAELDTSDTDNGKRLLAHFGDDLSVLAMDGSAGGDWLAWTGTHWDMSGGLANAQERAKQVGDKIVLESGFIAETEAETAEIDAAAEWGYDRQKLDRPFLTLSDFPDKVRFAAKAFRAWQTRSARRSTFGVTSKNAGRVDAMLKMAASEIRRAPEEYNPDPLTVATESHTLVFRRVRDLECPDPDVDRYTVELEAIEGHRRNDWRTAAVPVAWKGLDVTSVKWTAFLDRCMPNAEKRRTVQQVAGLGLLGMSPQKIMFHYGVGANGKSVFLETIARILGSGLMVGLPRESIIGAGERSVGGASPDLVRLYGKTMVRILEVPGDEPLQEDLIKRLTGGEPFPVRTLFKGYFEFQNVATPHMSGNGLPTINGTDNGIWRRMLLVHWDQTIPDDEQRDFEEFVTELVREDAPGILAWLVAGALDYLQNGLQVAPDIRSKTDAYHEEMDPIGEFLAACVVQDEFCELQANEFYQAYVDWSMANAKRHRTNTKFGRTIKEKYRKVTKNGRIYYEGIRLQDVPKRPEPPDKAGGMGL